MDFKLQGIVDSVVQEFNRATSKFGNFHNAHEGYAVLLEEVDELWEAVKMNQKHPERTTRITDEATQVAAMAMRILVDCGSHGSEQSRSSSRSPKE